MSAGDFGCARCWPAKADEAWAARDELRRGETLIGESHFHVITLACPHCAQRFVSVFTETIDWDDGEDPQYWTVLPLTEAEAASLAGGPDGEPSEAALNALGPGRRSLYRDHPKGAPPRVYWGSGIYIGPHD